MRTVDTPETGAPLDGTKYRLVAPLGKGGMGHVWLAEHVSLNAEVVVKLLDPSLLERRDLGDRMRLEAQVLGRIRHANVVSVIDGGRTEGGFPFLVMERLHGRTLHAELAQRHTLPIGEAIALAKQALSGLVAVHASGIVHRDVKASNLFLCDADPSSGGERRLKLIDFGIVKLVGDTPNGIAIEPLAFPTVAGTVLGTPTALSPEQARGLAVDARTDVYAVGLILYQLISGVHPFAGLHGAKLVKAYTTRTPDSLASVASQPVPAELDAIVMKALGREPQERFSSAAELIRALERVEEQLVKDASAPEPDRAAVTALDLAGEGDLDPEILLGPPPSSDRTELLESGEVRALNAQMGILCTDDLPPTRTVAPVDFLARARRRFISVSFATAVIVAAVLAQLLWK